MTFPYSMGDFIEDILDEEFLKPELITDNDYDQLTGELITNDGDDDDE